MYVQTIFDIIISDISEHFPIYTHLSIFQLSKTLNGENIDKFKQSLSLVDWVGVVNEAF